MALAWTVSGEHRRNCDVLLSRAGDVRAFQLVGSFDCLSIALRFVAVNYVTGGWDTVN